MRRPTGLVAHEVSAFRAERLVLRGVSLHVPPGAAALLLGPNGAGKSTLLRVLAGLKRPDAGHVTWMGADPRDLPPTPGPPAISYLGHLDAIKPGLTLRENLRFPHPPAHPDALGLRALLDVPARLLSAGQKRRAALTRLVGQAPGEAAGGGAGAGQGPRLWLLDEPTVGLDADSVSRLGELMRAHLASGGAIVAATHLPLPLPSPLELHL